MDTLLGSHGVGALMCPHILIGDLPSIHVPVRVLLSMDVLLGDLLRVLALVGVLLVSIHALV